MTHDEIELGRIFEDKAGKRFVVLGIDRDDMVEYVTFDSPRNFWKRHIDSLAEWTRCAINPLTGETIRGDAMYQRIEAQQASTAQFNDVLAAQAPPGRVVERQSHICPTCNGRKWVEGIGGDTSSCDACEGSGVLWTERIVFDDVAKPAEDAYSLYVKELIRQHEVTPEDAQRAAKVVDGINWNAVVDEVAAAERQMAAEAKAKRNGESVMQAVECPGCGHCFYRD